MPKFLAIHNESNIDRVLLESRWTEIAKDPRADWQLTLFSEDPGERYSEWDAPDRYAIETIFRDLEIGWSEILEVEVTSPSEWRLWEMELGKGMTNCWEALGCGREPGGARAADEAGVCPVAVNTGNRGKNRGRFSGRYCWKVVGTFCESEVQDDYARKMVDCAMCEFFQRVKDEEGDRFEP